MSKIKNSTYPKPRDWDAKVFSMPNIPRGNGFPETLQLILISLLANTPFNTVIKVEGSNSNKTLEDLCVRLRPSGFVRKAEGIWQVTPNAKTWLESEDNLYLSALLNANIRFYSEILVALKSNPKQISELQEIAKKEYNLNWKTKSEILARLNWLKDLGLVAYEDFTYLYSITNLGKKHLEELEYVLPEDLVSSIDTTKGEEKLPVSDWAIDMCDLSSQELNIRKTSIGYFPGSLSSVHDTVSDYLLMMSNPTDISKIVNYSIETYGIKDTSTKSLLSNLNYLGFIERKSRTHYKTTELGEKITAHNYELNFACCIHNKYSFTFEILFELLEKDLDSKQLAVISKVSYGFPSENKSEINKRLTILRNARLIQEFGINAYCLTERGKAFCDKLKQFGYQKIDQNKNETEISDNQINTDLDEYLNEIRLSSRDSSDPDRFEKALREGFSLLGFKAEWLGGSGKTDILLQAPTAPRYAYSVAIDAKSTYSGCVTEGQINFDTLTDHKLKHKANFSVVVGHEFQGERLIDRAEKHKVTLIDIERLETLIRWHEEVPLKSDAYKKIFMQQGIVDLEVIKEDRNKVIREGKLLKAIMQCLSNESNDPVTEGIIQPREIYHLLKHHEKFEPAPTLEEIKFMLEFLSSPLIACVSSTKEGYFALGSLTDAKQKFDFYLKACSTAN
ncbi:putative transcriptional regulator [Salirhabdus euzebyi]|uniref:Putative transcriptional regulator n=1 Tax=Salirhabdus euzebyi TaxID=394506 RepID=A0A841PVC9_9BACI|nr:hypothetical protein [Salirhabdus euzebyi]MBB6452770.1 putative transcriptional regulator [Salirhabdus euzebyi]